MFHGNRVDAQKQARGSDCEVGDVCLPERGSGPEGNCSEYVYMWFHNGQYMNDVCYQNGIITPIVEGDEARVASAALRQARKGREHPSAFSAQSSLILK